MKLQPLHDRVIIEQAPSEEKTQGGILLPDTAKEKPQKGKVIAVGPGKMLDNGQRAPVDVNANDLILYGKYSGTEVSIEGQQFIIIRAEDILAVLEGNLAGVGA